MKKLIYILGAVGLMLSSCHKQQSDSLPHSGEIRFTTQITTCSSSDAWEENNQIGVYINQSGATLGEIGANALHITDGTGKLSTDTPHYYPPKGNIDVLAYYPYDEDVTPTAYAVDVADQSDQGAIDFMIARAANVGKSPNAVNLYFDHKLSRVDVTITTDGTIDEADLAGMTVKLVGTKRTASYDLTNDLITPTGTAEEITLLTDSDGLSVKGIVVPQSLSGVKLICTTVADGTHEADVSTAAFLPGKRHTYRATLSSDGVELSAATITSWGEGNGTGENLEATTPPPTYYLADFDHTHVPAQTDEWIVMDAGTPDKDAYAGILEALNGLYTLESDRRIALIFPNIVEVVNDAFKGAKNIRMLNFPKVTTINGDSFNGMKNLRTLYIPLVTKIPANGLKALYSLNTVNINSVTSVELYGFDELQNLVSFEAPALTSVSSQTFRYCESLTHVYLPELTYFGSNSFSNCDALVSFEAPKVTSIYDFICANSRNLKILKLGSDGTTKVKITTIKNRFAEVINTANIDLTIGDVSEATPAVTIDGNKITVGSTTYTFKSINAQ